MNIISRVTQLAANSLFPRVLMRNTEKHNIHSLCGNITSRIGGNLQDYNSACSGLLLQPKLPIFNQLCGMKYKVNLRLRCRGCYFVHNKGVRYVRCKVKPRHKQSAFAPKERNTWIWTCVTQSKKREW
ncbi:uncharacterized protein LOC122502992 [Leptopilina heterotoma]|uniref:uncharacterized protein LOC122502992 n=1 Tax=Leptopilina heterotoma TaxID=63436 RepID=UPI001CA84585|nr:uncharacterized protein LOC122502992 [Leptopilina heterotoma]